MLIQLWNQVMEKKKCELFSVSDKIVRIQDRELDDIRT